MLIRLSASQISKAWELIKHALEEALPPFTYGDPEKYNNILECLLAGTMHCWIAHSEKKPCAIIITTFNDDACSGVRNLLVYILFALDYIPDALYQEGWNDLAVFGRANGCHRIIAYSSNPRVLRMVQAIGADTQYHFITYDVTVPVNN